MKNFSRINLEASIIQDKSNIPVVPEVYQYGKLSLNNEVNTYRLKTDKARKYMRIQFSPNSKNINFSFSNKPGDKLNSTFSELNYEFINGKQVITFDSNPNQNTFIYLNIFHNDPKATTEKTTNYVFKYMNSDNIKGFNSYILPEGSGFQLDKKKMEINLII